MPYPFYQRRRDGAPAPFGFVPFSAEPTVGPDTSSAPIVKVMDNAQPYPRPGFTPVPPDIFREWRKHAERGLTGLIHSLDRGWAGPGYSNDPDCDDEWDKAYKACKKSFEDRGHRELTSNMRGDLGMSKCMKGQVRSGCELPDDAIMKKIIRFRLLEDD